jgi:hypothetical protein
VNQARRARKGVTGGPNHLSPSLPSLITTAGEKVGRMEFFNLGDGSGGGAEQKSAARNRAASLCVQYP